MLQPILGKMFVLLILMLFYYVARGFQPPQAG